MTMKSFILQMDTGICSEWEKKNKRKRGIRLRDTPRSLELPSRNDGFKCIHPLQKQCFSDQRFASVQGRTWLSIDDNPANNDGLIYSTSSIKPPEAFQLVIGELGGFWVVYWLDTPLRLIRSLGLYSRSAIALWLPVICGAAGTSAVHCASTQINGLLSSQHGMGGPQSLTEDKDMFSSRPRRPIDDLSGGLL